MSPPIFTPDGSEVSEIVLPDGETASEVVAPDGSVVVVRQLADSVIARWNFEDDTDTTTILDGVNGFNGTNSGVTYSTDSEVDSLAGEYDGSSFFTTDDWAGGLSALSFGGYIKETTGNSRRRIIAGSNLNIRLFLNQVENNGFTLNINDEVLREGSLSYTVGNYEFVAIVYDKTGLGDGNTAKIFTGDANEVAAGSPSTADVDFATNIEYGRKYGGGDPWVGLCDDLRAYNKALSPNEISNWFNTGTIQ
jgi:hypothetical protein